MIHHSALGVRKLRSMKILDHYSVSVEILRADGPVNELTMSHSDTFGQFGEIQSLRILEEADPIQILVRYTKECAATAAIRWCLSLPEVFNDAKNGYQKYCIKFINKQQCHKLKCPNRHSWANAVDIMSFADTRLMLDESSQSLFPAPTASPERMELERLRTQCRELQQQSQQSLAEINSMKAQLRSVERENLQLAVHVKAARTHQQSQQRRRRVPPPAIEPTYVLSGRTIHPEMSSYARAYTLRSADTAQLHH